MIKHTMHGKFLLQVLKGRWMVVVVCIYILSFAGAPYIFGIYSGAIKSELQYTQEIIDTLTFFKDLGSNVGVLSGLLSEVLPTWIVLAVGAGMNVLGFSMIWMAVTHRIARPPNWQMYLYLSIGSNSQSFFNTAVIVTCVKNFPESRGAVLGLVKGCIGLSGAILTQVYHAVYGQDSKGMILLLGWLPSLVTLLFMFLVRPMKPDQTHDMDKREGKHFFSFLYVALILAAFLMLIIIVENQVHLSSIAYKAIGTITLLLVALNVIVAIRAERQKSCDDLSAEKMAQTSLKGQGVMEKLANHDVMSSIMNEQTRHVEHKLHSSLKLQEDDFAVKHVSKEEASILSNSIDKDQCVKYGGDTNQLENKTTLHSGKLVPDQLNKFFSRVNLFISKWPERGDDFSIPHALLSLDMWILFAAATCGVGTTLTAIDNIGQIGASLGYSQVSISTCVSLISIWNFLGRVGAGFISETLLQRYRFPRTLMLTIVMGIACAGHLMIAIPGTGTLYAASIILGLSFGAQWPLLFAVISELFGLKYYATLYNVAALASPVGSYVFNVRVAGYLYDREARRHAQQLLALGLMRGGQQLHEEVVCEGAACFRLTFLIMCMTSVVGCIISGALVLRTKRFYSQDIYAKYRLERERKG